MMRAALAVCVAGAYAIVLAALFGVHTPTWAIALVLLSIATIVTLGTFFPNLAVFVNVVTRGAPGARGAALTFDDGPHPIHTRSVLDALDKVGAKGTFFVIGNKVEAHPEVVAEIVRRGHEVGIHSWDHDRLLNMRREPNIVRDLEKTRDAIERATGIRPKLFRPPVGLTSPRTRVAVGELGLTVIGWNARAFDGAGRPSTERVISRIAPALDHGSIVLLHDAAERGDAAPTSLGALPELLALMEKRGLEGVTVTRLLEEQGQRVAALSSP
jgi:peptidoglycan-N-acetylglucosamine deacetylase